MPPYRVTPSVARELTWAVRRRVWQAGEVARRQFEAEQEWVLREATKVAEVRLEARFTSELRRVRQQVTAAAHRMQRAQTKVKEEKERQKGRESKAGAFHRSSAPTCAGMRRRGGGEEGGHRAADGGHEGRAARGAKHVASRGEESATRT